MFFEGEEAWTKSGITDLKHLLERITKHEASFNHIYNQLQLETFGSVNILSSLNEGHRLSVIRRINCVKFCATHELPL